VSFYVLFTKVNIKLTYKKVKGTFIINYRTELLNIQ